MAWVHLDSVYGWDLNGAGYALLGQLYYDNVQDIANNRTAMKIDAYKYAAGGLIDFDVRTWGVGVAAAGDASGGYVLNGNAAPRFDGMTAGQTALLGSSSTFYITHAADGTAQILADASWAATSGGSWFDAGFYGAAGPFSLPAIPRQAFKRYTGVGSATESERLDRYTGVGSAVAQQKMERYTGSAWVREG